MANVDGVGVPPTGSPAPAGGVARSSGARAVAGVGGVRGVSAAGGFGLPEAPGFDPVAAVTAVAKGAAMPPPAGLSARLMEWAAPSSRQFEAMTPARLLPLLGVAVDRLASEAQQVDLLGELGAVALTRELDDHRVLAERRATMIEG